MINNWLNSFEMIIWNITRSIILIKLFIPTNSVKNYIQVAINFHLLSFLTD